VGRHYPHGRHRCVHPVRRRAPSHLRPGRSGSTRRRHRRYVPRPDRHRDSGFPGDVGRVESGTRPIGRRAPRRWGN
jgi:hypothetical protein